MTSKLSYESKLVYDPSHWALHYLTSKDKVFVAHFQHQEMEAVLKLNATDSRGYRGIITMVSQDMTTTLNRPSTLREKLFIQKVAALVLQAYEGLGLLAQMEIAGNNSHEFDSATGVTHVGTKKEPTMLHVHLIGRGDPTYEFVRGVPLRGPCPGQLFNMRGDGSDDGNKTKTKWSLGEVDEMFLVKSALKAQLEQVCQTEEFTTLGIEVTY